MPHQNPQSDWHEYEKIEDNNNIDTTDLKQPVGHSPSSIDKTIEFTEPKNIAEHEYAAALSRSNWMEDQTGTRVMPVGRKKTFKLEIYRHFEL